MGTVIPFPTEPDQGAQRLRALSDQTRDDCERYTHSLRARNAAIIEEIDSGMPQNRAAKICRVAPSTITRILSLPSYGEPDTAA